MANNCRFLSRFYLEDGEDKLRIDYSESGAIDLTFTEGDYWWSLDDSEEEGALDFAKQLKDKLDTAAPAGTWTVQIVGVNYTDADAALGSIRLSVDLGTFNYDWEDEVNTTVDPLIFGYATESDNPDPAVAIISPYGARYQWCPDQPVWDDAAVTRNIQLSQSMTSGGYISTVHWVTSDVATFRVEYILSARVSIDCARSAARAAAAGIEQGDPNTPFEAWYMTALIDRRQIRLYSDISSYADPDEDVRGEYEITVGGGTSHNSLGTAVRPLPATADVYSVSIPCTQSR
mgnify:CR=1 FL=1